MPSFSVKQWHSGTQAQDTPVNGPSLQDMETRLSDFTHQRALHAGLTHATVWGASYNFGGPPTVLWTDNFTDIAFRMIGIRSRRNISYSGSIVCHPMISATSDPNGGWAKVFQNTTAPGDQKYPWSGTVSAPYPPAEQLVVTQDALNDLWQLGPSNPTPMQHAHRAVLSHFCRSVVYNAVPQFPGDQGATSTPDAAWSLTNAAGSGQGGWTATITSLTNAGYGYWSTSTATDKAIYTVVSDAPSGRVHDIFLLVQPTDDTTLAIAVNGTSYGTVRLQGSVLCDPNNAHTWTNVYCMRLGSNGPTDPTGGATLHAGDQVKLTLQSGSKLAISHAAMESDPPDGPLLVSLSSCRMATGYGFFSGFPHGSGITDADVLSWISSQQTIDSEFSSRLVGNNGAQSTFNYDTVLQNNPAYWGDGNGNVGSNPHPNLLGHDEGGKALGRAILQSNLLTDRVRTAARIEHREFYLPVGDVSASGFANGWDNARPGGSYSWAPAGFSIDLDGRVWMRGVVDGTNATGATIFTLPVGLRPEYLQLLPAVITDALLANGVQSTVLVNNDGTVQVNSNASSVVGQSSKFLQFSGSFQAGTARVGDWNR